MAFVYGMRIQNLIVRDDEGRASPDDVFRVLFKSLQ